MTWAQRLKRVFSIDPIAVCGRCGGSVRGIVEASNRCIEDQDVIPDKAGQALDRIPTHPLLPPPGTLPLFAGKDSSPTAIRQQGSQ